MDPPRSEPGADARTDPPDDGPARARSRPSADWSFEVKWDGVRAIAYVAAGAGSAWRAATSTRSPPRTPRSGADRRARHARGRARRRDPRLRRDRPAELRAPPAPYARPRRRLDPPAGVPSTPVVYAIFDLLYLDGHSLMERPYREPPRGARGARARRRRVAGAGRASPRFRAPRRRPGPGTGGGDRSQAPELAV